MSVCACHHYVNIYLGVLYTFLVLPLTLTLTLSLSLSHSYAANSTNLLGDVSHLTLSQLEDWGVGLAMGILWEEALHSALMPITPQASMGSLAEGIYSFLHTDPVFFI